MNNINETYVNNTKILFNKFGEKKLLNIINDNDFTNNHIFRVCDKYGLSMEEYGSLNEINQHGGVTPRLRTSSTRHITPTQRSPLRPKLPDHKPKPTDVRKSQGHLPNGRGSVFGSIFEAIRDKIGAPSQEEIKALVDELTSNPTQLVNCLSEILKNITKGEINFNDDRWIYKLVDTLLDVETMRKYLEYPSCLYLKLRMEPIFKMMKGGFFQLIISIARPIIIGIIRSNKTEIKQKIEQIEKIKVDKKKDATSTGGSLDTDDIIENASQILV